MRLFFFIFMTAFTFSALAESPIPQKDLLMCSFTEPFFNITYDANRGTVTYVGVDSYDKNTGTFASETLAQNAKIVGSDLDNSVMGSKFQLLDDKGQVILHLVLNFQGSNGMSDEIYPFDAWYMGSKLHYPLQGGCESTSAPAVNPLEILEKLKR